MNTNEPKSMNPNSLPFLVGEGGLKYCCVHAFFFINNFGLRMLSERLGLSERTIRKWRSEWLAGEHPCECKEGCLKARGALKVTNRRTK